MMTLCKFLLAAFLLICGAVNTVQANEQVKTEPLQYGQKLTFKSTILNETLNMNLYLPSSFEEASADHTYPVIFINGGHGDKFFLTLSGIVKHLSELDRIPESIVVSLTDGNYSPSLYTNGMWSARDKLEGDKEPEKYFSHLKQELFPYLAKNYRAADSRMIIGVSGSALFPLYAMINEPDMFEANIFLAAADMIGMGYKPGQTLIDLIAQTFAKQQNPKGYLYFANSDDDMDHAGGAYKNNYQLLSKKLAPSIKKGLKFKVDIIENERHYDAFIKAMLSAFEMIYPEQQWAPKYRELIKQPGDAMANIDAVYQQLSSQYGFTILPKGDRWNSVNSLSYIAFKLFKDGRVDESVTVAKRWAQYRPKSAQAFEQLAKGLAAGKQMDKALKAQQKAIDLAKLYSPDNVALYQEGLVKLKNK